MELQEAAKASIGHVVLANCQNIMYSMKSSYQVKKMEQKPNSSTRMTLIRKNPQVVGLSLTLHHDTWNKGLLDLLSSHGFCVPYKRTMLLETSLANAVNAQMQHCNGIYLPPGLRKE